MHQRLSFREVLSGCQNILIGPTDSRFRESNGGKIILDVPLGPPPKAGGPPK